MNWLFVSFEWIAMILALWGMVLNNHKKRICFVVWFASSILGIILYVRTEMWGLVFRDIMYLILFVYGFILWSRKNDGTPHP